ncbi:MAG: Rne/Rng family ribonuclease [Polyangiaceae bacterium]|nr:Rne/Rng family ribonuclease [Polyangiaceae bacterium]
MARNVLVINCDLRETRVCLIEDGVIAELHLERQSARGAVGNIVLGRVTRVLPGMQAAFIDVGMERAAFLHVEDLIRPDDFEAYLSHGGGADALEGGRRAAGLAEDLDIEIEAEEDGDDEEDEGDEEEEDEEEDSETDEPRVDADDSDEADQDSAVDMAAPRDEAESADELDADESEYPLEPSDADLDEEDVTDPDARFEPDSDPNAADSQVSQPAAGEGSDAGDRPQPAAATSEASSPEPEEEDVFEPAEPWSDEVPDADRAPADLGAPQPARAASDAATVPTASRQEAGPAPQQRQPRRGPGEARGPAPGRSRHRERSRSEAGVSSKSGEERGALRRVSARPSRVDGGRAGRNKSGRRGRHHQRGAAEEKTGRGRRARMKPNGHRTSRSVPITEVVKEGDEVIVQISKEPIGTKGARVTSHVSLPGRYVVYLPTVEHIGISRRIGNARERARLRKVIEALKPAKGGLIVRTVAAGLTKKALKRDIAYLIKLWEDVSRKHENAQAPTLLYSELDLVLKTARDLFTPEIERIVIDDREQHARLARFVEMFMPERARDIELFSDDEPIFDAYGIEDEIGRALSRKVPLPSGGYLIIDQAEALTAIDVNTGRFVGKGSKDLEETALRTNLEAVAEIAYQLRFRNIGGLIILDLIDMDMPANRESVWRALEQSLSKDKAKTTLNRISDLGLIEMTRKRTRESLSRTMHEPCFYCDGTGQIQSRTTVAYEILRQIRRERDSLKGYSVVVNAHPAIVDLMTGEEKQAVAEAERRYMRRIELVPRREYHIEQFDLQGK